MSDGQDPAWLAKYAMAAVSITFADDSHAVSVAADEVGTGALGRAPSLSLPDGLAASTTTTAIAAKDPKTTITRINERKEKPKSLP
jgi:hypothetical protein